MRVVTIITAFAALLVCACTQSGPTAEPDIASETNKAISHIVDRDRVEARLTKLFEEGSVAGASALVFENGEEVYRGAVGMADREAGTPMANDTLVQIYSMTKPITGVALMTLYEDGLFQLDDPISKYIPELADLKVMTGTDENGKPVLVDPDRAPTVRDFMMHTAGIGDADIIGGELYSKANSTNYQKEDPANLGNSLVQVAEKFGSLPLAYQPGTRWHYGDSVEMQALMVERLSGKPFAQYLQETIFDPLGMNDTGHLVEENDRARLSGFYQTHEDGSLYQVSNAEAHMPVIKKLGRNMGSWGLVSTLDDYMTFALMLQGEGTYKGVQIIQPETVRLMSTSYLSESVTERHFLPNKGQVGFGLNFADRVAPPVNSDENYGEVGEFFWDGYASTLFWVDPKNDLTAVFFVQLIPFNNDVHHAFRAAVYGVEE